MELLILFVSWLNIELAGANPSAEEADEGDAEVEAKTVLDIEDAFQLMQIDKPTKPDFKAELKGMLSWIHSSMFVETRILMLDSLKSVY